VREIVPRAVGRERRPVAEDESGIADAGDAPATLGSADAGEQPATLGSADETESAASARPDRRGGRPQVAPEAGPASGQPEVRPRGPRGPGGETVGAPAAVAAPPAGAPGSAE